MSAPKSGDYGNQILPVQRPALDTGQHVALNPSVKRAEPLHERRWRRHGCLLQLPPLASAKSGRPPLWLLQFEDLAWAIDAASGTGISGQVTAGPGVPNLKTSVAQAHCGFPSRPVRQLYLNLWGTS